jgi:hypothetical protein
MKNYLKLIMMAGLSGLLFLTSCQKTDDDPETADDRDKLVGSWRCTESGQNANPTPYLINIDKAGTNAVEISNFAFLGSGESVIANVSGSAITIGPQTVSSRSVSGSGSYSNNKINFSYSLDGDNITAVCTRQ